ncbi:hypothetical protein ACIOEW_03430 [Streptomyces sp. NPDC087901]|uniref:hypothetical protein n=1 Tax=Streptomyces sp. NPDC087901 TaxID=3365818 RepID=UPI003800C893
MEPASLARNAWMDSAHMVLVLVAFCGGAAAAWSARRCYGLPEFRQALRTVVGAALGGTVPGGWKRMVQALELAPVQ